MADWRPMTDLERRAALALEPGLVAYLPGSPPKRFARNLCAQAVAIEPYITNKQAAAMWRQVWRYRRQIHDGELIGQAIVERNLRKD